MGRSSKYEAPEMGAFIARTLNAMARRAADGDDEALRQLALLQPVLRDAVGNAARGLHDFGQSWAFIGSTLGMTRQAAHEMYAPKTPKAKAEPDRDQLAMYVACRGCGGPAAASEPICPRCRRAGRERELTATGRKR